MTSIFDALAVIGLRAEHQMSLHPLAHSILDEAIKQIMAIDQTVVNWEKYQKKSKAMYDSLYGEVTGKIMMKATFVDNTHGRLDHNEKYHNRIFKGNFERLIYRIKNLILAKDREEAYFNIQDVHFTARKAYPDILEALKQLLKSGRIPQPEDRMMNKATKKWLGEYTPWENPFEKIEKEKQKPELIDLSEEKLELARDRAKSQKWGDTADQYEKDVLKRKRQKLRKKGR